MEKSAISVTTLFEKKSRTKQYILFLMRSISIKNTVNDCGTLSAALTSIIYLLNKTSFILDTQVTPMQNPQLQVRNNTVALTKRSQTEAVNPTIAPKAAVRSYLSGFPIQPQPRKWVASDRQSTHSHFLVLSNMFSGTQKPRFPSLPPGRVDVCLKPWLAALWHMWTKKGAATSYSAFVKIAVDDCNVVDALTLSLDIFDMYTSGWWWKMVPKVLARTQMFAMLVSARTG